MSVELLNFSYINQKYNKLIPSASNAISNKIKQKYNTETFLPIVFRDTGIAFANTFRRVLMEDVPCYAIKSSLDISIYEQEDSQGINYQNKQTYMKYQQINDNNDYFDKMIDRNAYLESSGFAKFEINETCEHNQILSERLGYIPINGNLFKIEHRNKMIPLDQLWIFIGKCDKDQIVDLSEIKPIQSKIYKEVTVEDMVVLYCDDNKWYQITNLCIPPDGYDAYNINDKFLFPCKTTICHLQPKQRIKASMRLQLDYGRNYAKWLPVICKYKFATQKDLTVDDKDQDCSQDYDSQNINDQHRQYIVTKNPDTQLIFPNDPEAIILTVESIHRLTVSNAVYRGFNALQNWIYKFRNNLLQTFQIDSDQLPISIYEYNYPLIILRLENNNHTFVNLIVDQIIRYMLDIIVKSSTDDNDKLVKIKKWFEDSSIAHRGKHPLRSDMYLTVKFPIDALNSVTQTDLDNYFGKMTSTDVDKCKILYLILKSLDSLDIKVDTIKSDFLDKIEPTRQQFKEMKCYDYDNLLSNQQLIYKYDQNTKYNFISPQWNYDYSSHENEIKQELLTSIFFISKFLSQNSDIQNTYQVISDRPIHGILKQMFPLVEFSNYQSESTLANDSNNVDKVTLPNKKILLILNQDIKYKANLIIEISKKCQFKDSTIMAIVCQFSKLDDEFYKGEIHTVAYGSKQIIIIDSKGINNKIKYDTKNIENFYHYINHIVRPHMKFNVPNNTYDNLMQLLIINQYVVKFYKDKMQCPLNYIEEWIGQINKL